MNNNNFNQFFSAIENLAAKGNLNEAAQQLQILTDEHNLILARAYNDSGVICYRQGAREQALEHYRKAVELAPQESVYRKNLADLCYFEYGNAEIALSHYRQILVNDPHDFDATLAIGRICADMGKHYLAEAKDFFELAEKINPNNEIVAEECRRLDTPPKRQSQRKTKKKDNVSEEYATLAKNFQPENAANTEKIISSFLKMYPDFALGYNDLGVISHQLEKFEQSGRCYHEAVRLEPENCTFRKNLADFLFIVEGKPETAMEHYHAVLETNPKDIETLMMIGNICLALNSDDEACNFFNLVLDLEPWNSDASTSIKMLNEKRNNNNNNNK